MEEISWAIEETRKWIDQNGGTCMGVERQLDGRWFANVVTNEENWCPRRNMFVSRFADLGQYPED